ncbi:MAG TPA: FAD-dependent oxidoreductase [Candidatus Paceibacterota bacterium]|nr:FAD-dependent oxidoreductase [Candidatus Paceibacterota bacterium]
MAKKRKKILILGAGFTGLVSAYYLSKDFNVTVIEKEDFIGGTARGFTHGDFLLDSGPHKLYTELPGIMEEISSLVPLVKVQKKNSIYLKGKYFDFPLKLSQIATKIPVTAVKTGFSIFTKSLSKRPDDSYENFLINRFGKTLYELSFKDYAFKVWNSDPQKLDPELAKRRVAVKSVSQLIKSIIFKNNKEISAEYFYYPEKGIKNLLDQLNKEITKNKGKILTNSKIQEIKISKSKIQYVLVNGKKIKADYYVSTIPLDDLYNLTENNHQKESEELIRYNKLNIIYFVLNKPRAMNDCWVFFPENKIIFQRVSEQKAFSSEGLPEDKTVIMVETTKEITDDLINKIINQLEEVKIAKKDEIIEHFVMTLPKAYPIYLKGYKENLSNITNFFEKINNFYLLGRQGLFNYNNIDQCWDMAIKLTDQITNKKTSVDWQGTKNYFDSYRIVD